MAAKYKHGDLLQSKAGGPKLVVDHIYEPIASGPRFYSCTWWIGKKHERERFSEDALQPWSDENAE